MRKETQRKSSENIELLRSDTAPTTLLEFTELERALSSDRPVTEALRDSALALLTKDGKKEDINGMPGTVTEHYSEITVGKVTYFARIGRREEVDDDRLLILFDTNPDTKVQTPNPYAVYFKELGSVTDLIVYNEEGGDVEPFIDKGRYIELVKYIIEDIAHQYESKAERDQKEAFERREARNPISILKKYFTDDSYAWGEFLGYGNKGERRQAYALIGGIALLFSYGHLPFAPVDARIGRVPLPSPVELVVDLFNRSDHKAQGFDKPEGAVELTIGDVITDLPLLSDYDTSGVPGAGNTGFTNVTQRTHPGLYEVHFEFNEPESVVNVDEGESVEPDTEESDTSCLSVSGNFTTGKTSLFTQTAGLDGMLEITVVDTDSLELCASTEQEITGSVFFFQDNN